MATSPVRDGFWLQHTHTNGGKLLDLADALASTAEGRPGFVAAPVNVKPEVNAYFRRARRAGDAIIDPQGHILDKPVLERNKVHYPWLEATRPTTQAGWTTWMQQGFDDQLSRTVRLNGRRPSFAITPSPNIPDAPGSTDLTDVLSAATAVIQGYGGPSDCWVGLHVDQQYLRNDSKRATLISAMLAVPAKAFVFRSPQQYLPPVSGREYVNGLKAVVEACAQNGVRVFLPSSGWLGWLAMGWGAWGFSGGLAGATWVDHLPPSGFNSPLEPSLPFFEPQLLRTVPWRVHLRLAAEQHYLPCACPECSALLGSYRKLEAQRHQIRHGNIEGTKLTKLATVADRAAAIATRLDDAIVFRDNLSSAPLKADSKAQFLTFWRSLV